MMYKVSSLLRTTSLSLLLACTMVPNLAHAMEEDLDKIGSSPTVLATQSPEALIEQEKEASYASYIHKCLQDLAPEHQKSFVNGFVNEVADKLEIALHNLTVHFGSEYGQTISEKLHDLLVPIASAKAIEWKLAKLINVCLTFTANAVAPGSSVALDTPLGEKVVKKPIRTAGIDAAKPFTKAVSNGISRATKPMTRVASYGIGGMIGELIADRYFTDINQTLKAPFIREINYISTAYSEEYLQALAKNQAEYDNLERPSTWSISEWTSHGCAAAASHLEAGQLHTAENARIAGIIAWNASIDATAISGRLLAQQYVVQPLDNFGTGIGFNNYKLVITHDDKGSKLEKEKLSLTEEKSRSHVLKVAKSAYNAGSAAVSGASTARDFALDWTFGWLFPNPDALEFDFDHQDNSKN